MPTLHLGAAQHSGRNPAQPEESVPTQAPSANGKCPATIPLGKGQSVPAALLPHSSLKQTLAGTRPTKHSRDPSPPILAGAGSPAAAAWCLGITWLRDSPLAWGRSEPHGHLRLFANAEAGQRSARAGVWCHGRSQPQLRPDRRLCRHCCLRWPASQAQDTPAAPGTKPGLRSGALLTSPRPHPEPGPPPTFILAPRLWVSGRRVQPPASARPGPLA